MRYLVALSLVTACLALAAPAFAARSPEGAVPGTPQFATPVPGTAVVVPGPDATGRTFAPFANGTRVLTVFARLPAPVRRVATTVLLRHKPASGRCAASFAEDRGEAVALGAAFPDAAGHLAVTSDELRWRHTGRRRFCLWLTVEPSRRMTPVTQVITFTREAFGAVQYLYTGADGVASIATVTRSTGPYTVTSTASGCPPDRATTRTTERPTGDVYEMTQFVYGLPECDPRTTHAVTRSVVGAVTVSLSFSEASAGKISHAGACVFDDFRATVREAKRLVAAQGCRVGRTLSARTSKDTVTPGDVWSYTVNGSPVALVPQGTTVDIVVNR